MRLRSLSTATSADALVIDPLLMQPGLCRTINLSDLAAAKEREVKEAVRAKILPIYWSHQTAKMYFRHTRV
jgi:hypothetical protein